MFSHTIPTNSKWHSGVDGNVWQDYFENTTMHFSRLTQTMQVRLGRCLKSWKSVNQRIAYVLPWLGVVVQLLILNPQRHKHKR
jgi:hypothetical protein